MNGPVVVDASLAVKWLVKEEYSDSGNRPRPFLGK